MRALRVDEATHPNSEAVVGADSKNGNSPLTDGQWRDFGGPQLPPLLQAALDCFVEHGYHGTTIRVVASRAGLSVPGLYHHYPSKQALLVNIMEIAMEDLLRRSEAALYDAGTALGQRFRLVVECLLLFHAYRSDLAFIAATEIRSLEDKSRIRHIESRDRQQQILDTIVQTGTTEGAFATQYPLDASRAVTTMCTGVAQWYHLDGPLTPAEVAARYGEIALMAVGGVPNSIGLVVGTKGLD